MNENKVFCSHRKFRGLKHLSQSLNFIPSSQTLGENDKLSFYLHSCVIAYRHAQKEIERNRGRERIINKQISVILKLWRS